MPDKPSIADYKVRFAPMVFFHPIRLGSGKRHCKETVVYWLVFAKVRFSPNLAVRLRIQVVTNGKSRSVTTGRNRPEAEIAMDDLAARKRSLTKRATMVAPL